MKMHLPYPVYIPFSQKDHLLYIGYSASLVKHLERHNAGSARSTAARRPLQLIFCEFYLFKQDALKRKG
ncbi:MAG TPA: GIY-YIG nuclease family protein [Lacibacter sp.]|nr:GIY-YIG nuclease family protein [Lacibacter sp.]HMO88251.1 GIY-YIG nuclease family protein [Lacibacter sp.]